MTVDGQDLTRCGGCQGYMDFFSEVFCVVSFFFLLYFFAHQETPRWKTFSKTERKDKHSSVTFVNADSVKVLEEQLCLILEFRKETDQVL